MSTRTTVILFVTVFLIGTFLIVILPFMLVDRPKPTNPPPGPVEEDDEDVLKDQGVFRTDDGAKSWAQKPWIEGTQGSIAALDVNRLVQDAGNPDRLFLLTRGEGLWVSESRGELWAKVRDGAGVLNPQSNVLSLATNPENDLEWYVAVFQTNRGRLLRTTDGGQTFKEVYFTPLERYGIFDVVYDETRDTIIMVTGQGGFLESRDKGATWRVVRWFADGLVRLLMDPKNRSVLYAISSKGSVFRTEDRGASFADVTNGLRDHPGTMLNQHWSIDVTGALYLGSNYGVVRSRDHGRTYQAPPIIIPPDALPVLGIAVDPDDTGHILVSALNQLYESKDDGRTWAILLSPSAKRTVQLFFDGGYVNTLYSVIEP